MDGTLSKQPVPWGWASATAVSLVAFFVPDILFYVAFLFINLTDMAVLEPPGELSIIFMTYVLARLSGLGVVYAYVRAQGGGLKDLGFRKFKVFKAVKVILLALVAFGVIALAAGMLIEYFLPSINLNESQDIPFLNAQGLLELTLTFVALVIIAPVAEETIFRGFLLPAYQKSFGKTTAIIITSLMFGWLHMPIGPAIIIGIFAGVLAWAYYKTESLWPAIIIHSIKNLVAFIAIFMGKNLL